MGFNARMQSMAWSFRLRNLLSVFSWVAVKELKLSYYIGETLLFTIHTHYGNLI